MPDLIVVLRDFIAMFHSKTTPSLLRSLKTAVYVIVIVCMIWK
jgi:hypothetical protein